MRLRIPCCPKGPGSNLFTRTVRRGTKILELNVRHSVRAFQFRNNPQSQLIGPMALWITIWPGRTMT